MFFVGLDSWKYLPAFSAIGIFLSIWCFTQSTKRGGFSLIFGLIGITSLVFGSMPVGAVVLVALAIFSFTPKDMRLVRVLGMTQKQPRSSLRKFRKLKRAYAKGRITKEQYLSSQKDLKLN